MDLAYQQTCKTESNLLIINNELKDEAREVLDNNDSEIVFHESHQSAVLVTEWKNHQLKNKLMKIRKERQNSNDDTFEVN